MSKESTGKRITDELRLFAAEPYTGWEQQADLRDIADRIDAEHERQLEVLYRDMSDAEYVKLPVDADGVPIRLGDVMEGTCPSGKHVNGTVNAIGDGVFWLSNVQFSLKPNYMHHHHEPTVEDVLREFADAMNENMGMYTGEVIDADEWRDADRKTIADFAAKLRLAGDAE